MLVPFYEYYRDKYRNSSLLSNLRLLIKTTITYLLRNLYPRDKSLLLILKNFKRQFVVHVETTQQQIGHNFSL